MRLRLYSRLEVHLMLGALVTIVLVAAVAYAVTQVGGVITLLFIGAVLFLAYRRLSLFAFSGH